MSQHLFFITQDGGKYGRTLCPICGGRIQYKFTAGAGGCDDCECVVFNTGEFRQPMDGTDRPDVFMKLQVEGPA